MAPVEAEVLYSTVPVLAPRRRRFLQSRSEAGQRRVRGTEEETGLDR